MTEEIPDATSRSLSPEVALARLCWLGATVALAFSCGGDKFVAQQPSAVGGDGGHAAVGVGDVGGPAGDSSLGPGGTPPASAGASLGGATEADAGGGGVAPAAGSGGVAPRAGSGGLGIGGGVVDTPVPLERLELWFDVEEGVMSSVDGVSIWKDRSPHRRDALQTSTNLMPSLVPGGLNGKPTIVFDGVDDFMEVPALPGDFTRGVSIFVVGQTDGDGGDGSCMGYFEASNGKETEDLHLGFWQNRYLYEVADVYLQVDATRPQQKGSPELLVGLQEQTGAVEVRRNSNAIGKSQMALPVLKPREHVYLGNSQYENCTVLHGRLSEVIVYSRRVTPKELLAIEAYLKTKWACCGQ